MNFQENQPPPKDTNEDPGCFAKFKEHAIKIGKIAVPVGIDIGTKAYTISQHVPTLKEACQFAKTLLTRDCTKISKACSKLSPQLTNQLSAPAKNIVTNVASGTPITSEQVGVLSCDVNQCQQTICKNLIWCEVIGSGVVVATQVWSLYQVGKELTEAKNVCAKSKELPEIKAELEELKNKFEELCAYIDELNNKDEVTVLDIVMTQAKIREMDVGLRKVGKRISMLQLEINGKTVTLSIQKSEIMREGIVSGAQVLTHLIELAAYGPNMSAGLKGFKIACTVVFAALVAAKGVQYNMTSDRLKELAKIWIELEKLDEFQDDIQAMTDEAMKWLAVKTQEAQKLQK